MDEFGIYINLNCIYKDICTDKGNKCKDCKNNQHKSYYEPIDYFPYVNVNWNNDND